jgi:hypothetical protein
MSAFWDLPLEPVYGNFHGQEISGPPTTTDEVAKGKDILRAQRLAAAGPAKVAQKNGGSLTMFIQVGTHQS